MELAKLLRLLPVVGVSLKNPDRVTALFMFIPISTEPLDILFPLLLLESLSWLLLLLLLLLSFRVYSGYLLWLLLLLLSVWCLLTFLGDSIL